MTDHLEPYRRMARSIRSLPPVSLTHPSQESITQPLTPAPVVTASPRYTTTESNVSQELGSPIDPSERIAALVQEAVTKPTVLPETYTIQENIGDRISRLTTSKPVESKIVPSESPQPVYKATTHVSPNLALPSDPSERIAALVQEAVTKPTVLPETYTIQENIGDRISRLTTSKPVESKIAPSESPQPGSKATTRVSPNLTLPSDPSERIAALVHEAVTKPTVLPAPYTMTIQENIGDRISRLTTPKPVESKIVPPEIPQPDSNSTSVQTLESQPMEADLKKSLDDPHIEASVSSTVGAEAPTVEETLSDDAVGVVAEPLEVEETTENQASTVVVEPFAVEETTHDKGAAAVITEPAEVEEIPNNEPVTLVTESAEVEETPNSELVAETEEAPAPTLLEKVSSVIEAVSTAFKHPEADQKDSETVVEPSPSDVATTETPTTDTAEPMITEAPASEAEEAQSPTLLEKVSSVIEAVSTAFKHPEADQKDSETVVEPSASDVATTETPTTDTVEPMITEAPASEAEEAQSPTLLEKVSSVIEAVSTAFKHPEADQKDSETVVEPSPSDIATTETPTTDTVEPMITEAPASEAEEAQSPTLLEQVSSVIEAVATVFKQQETEPKDSEAVVEPLALEPTETEAPTADTVESLTTEAPASEIENTQVPTLLPQGSSVEAVATPLKESEADQKNSEALVESAPAAAENASDTKTVETTCPSCESTDIRKNGRRQGKQRYVCKDCGREFVMPSSAKAEDKPKKQASSPVEKAKVKGTGSSTTSGDSTSESSQPQSKKKAKSKGFGGSKKNK